MTEWILAVTMSLTAFHMPLGAVKSTAHETFQHQFETQESCLKAGFARKSELEGRLGRFATELEIEYECFETAVTPDA